MITCTLNNKKYTVDFITGRALREMEPAAKVYGKIVALSQAALKGETIQTDDQISIPEAMAGASRGRVISQKTRSSPAPRSRAASASEGSIPTSRAFTSI